MQFNQATPATWALTLGDALRVIMCDSERASLFYKIAAENAIAEGEAAKNSANAIKETYERQAEATETGAWGDIASASTNLVGEGIATGYSFYVNKQTSNIEAQLNTLNKNKEFIDDTARDNPAGFAAVRPGAPGGRQLSAGSEANLSAMNLSKEAFSTTEQSQIEAAAINNHQAFGKLQERAEQERTSLNKELDSLNRQKEYVGQNWRNRASIGATITKAYSQMRVADEQRLQAEAQKMQVLLNFVAELLKSIQGMLQQSASSASDQMLGKAHALIGAIAESNRA